MCNPKHSDRLWYPYSLLVSMNRASSPGLMWPGRETSSSPPSSAKVMMLSTNFPLVLRFQLN